MSSAGRTILLLSLALLLLTREEVSGLYFPQSDLTVRLPFPTQEGNKKQSDFKLITLRTLRNDSTIPKDATYSISSTQEKVAYLGNKNGNVELRVLPKQGVSGAIIVQANEKAGSEAVLEIKVLPVPVQGKSISCANYVQDMCFWNTSRYKIYENQPSMMLGTIGPSIYEEICPGFRITYSLLNASEFFDIKDKDLWSKSNLDRDKRGPPGGPGPHVDTHVRCVVWEEQTGNQHVLEKSLGIDIFDQDDNPPVPQTNSTVEITLRDFTAGDRLDDSNLVLTDNDDVSSNRYTVSIIGDIYNVLNITYTVMPIEHPKHPENPSSTAVLTRIYAKTTLLPKSPYRVILHVKDENLLPGYGNGTVYITLSFNGPQHRTTTTTVPSIPSKRPIFFPQTASVTRLASQFSRVAQPMGKPPSKTIFYLRGYEAFNVTQKGGIVYVANTTLLKSAPSTVLLTLKWKVENDWIMNSSAKVLVHLVDVEPTSVQSCNQSQPHSCANAKTKRECETSCGIGGGVFNGSDYNSACVWRSSTGNSLIAQMSEKYETCTPNLSHCPDNTCDELELLDHRICPQDCVIESEAHFAVMNKGGMGIKSGLGMCHCTDLLMCYCGTEFHDDGESNGFQGKGPDARNEVGRNRKDRAKEILVSGARKASSGPCGPTCMIGVISASLFVLVVIVGTFVTWRYRMASKGARRGCKHRVDDTSNGLGILPSDYVDRGDGLLIGLDTFTTANRHFLLPKTCPPDPKWEFPRSKLTIEQVLGEGEFGRVLRASAIDIGGWPGPTTVAVKTLKEDACASELTDLLSEYQLLKETQHPNIIRLLGACTAPGGPVYLIIEFAEFGSLRNYLRRSRHLESEGRVPCTSSLLNASPSNVKEELQSVDTAANYTITPRDILSFAWQISKGMAYLADIKLVHRDLAARNVLLASGKVCKISDFGLTRDVYEDDAYLKRSKGRVPVKWMAPESLADNVYTSKSDVWSFGVLLWELVTLGASPYPGVDVHNLYNLLKAGYRMERPANCSPQLYKLMVSCWHEEPGMRPSFKELTNHWEHMLEDGVEYLDLNPRTVHNQAYFASLHALDSPTNSNEGKIGNEKLNILRTDTVNYLCKPSSEPVTKCDKVDKLQTLWHEPIASFPEEPVKSPYVNERPPSLNINHYESPIKLRNASVTSNSENDLKTPTDERPQSYIDMQGTKSKETDDLLVFGNSDVLDHKDNMN